MDSTHRSATVVAPSLSRGGMTRAYFIAQLLQHLDYDVDVVGHLVRGESIYPEPPDGLRVIPISGSFPSVVRRVAVKVTGELVYSIKPLPTSFGSALLARRRGNRALVCDIDDSELMLRQAIPRRTDGSASRRMVRSGLRLVRRFPKRIRNQQARPYLRLIENQLSNADLITTNNSSLHAYYGGVMIPSGKDLNVYDPSRFDCDERRRALGLEGKFVVMFPGTAREHKGLEDVLLALDQIQNERIRLVIVGGRSIGKEYACELQTRWPQWIELLPTQSSSDMPGIIAAAHVIAIAQRDDVIARTQLPIKLSDAMAMARPIITTSVGDIPILVGDTAWVVPPSAPDAIAAALREIFDDYDSALERGARARARCAETMSFPVLAGVLKTALASI